MIWPSLPPQAVFGSNHRIDTATYWCFYFPFLPCPTPIPHGKQDARRTITAEAMEPVTAVLPTCWGCLFTSWEHQAHWGPMSKQSSQVSAPPMAQPPVFKPSKTQGIQHTRSRFHLRERRLVLKVLERSNIKVGVSLQRSVLKTLATR